MTSISGTVGAFSVSSPYPSGEDRSVAADDQSSSFERHVSAREEATSGEHVEPLASEQPTEPEHPRSQLQELLAKGPIRVDQGTWGMTFRPTEFARRADGVIDTSLADRDMYFPEIAVLGMERGRDVYDTLMGMSEETKARTTFHYGFIGSGPGHPAVTVPTMSFDDYAAAVKAYLDSEGTVVMDVPTVASEVPSGDTGQAPPVDVAASDAQVEELQAEPSEEDSPPTDGTQDASASFDFAAQLQAWLENFKTPEQQALPV